MVNLSNSGKDKHKTCSAQFDNHYNKKIRPIRQGSALHFGVAVDEAVNVLMLSKKKKLTAKEKKEVKQDPFEVFENFWYKMPENAPENAELLEDESGNLVPSGAPTSSFFEYYKKDFDETILDEADMKRLRDFIKIAGYIDDETNEVPDPIELYKELRERVDEAERGAVPNAVLKDSADISYYNYCNWLSVRQRGLLMIKTVKEEILPEIAEVKSVQRFIKIPNAVGDNYVGKLDFELSFTDDPKTFYTTDFKTSSSSSKYKVEDINKKAQIASYDLDAENGRGAYIVCYKTVEKMNICSKCETLTTNKRVKSCKSEIYLDGKKKTFCGGKFKEKQQNYIKWDILKDEIQDETIERVFKEVDEVLKKIKSGVFHQNRDECFQYGKKCVYYYYCRSNEYTPDITTIPLIQLKKKKK